MNLRDFLRIEDLSTSTLRGFLLMLERSPLPMPTLRARIEIELWKREVAARIEDGLARDWVPPNGRSVAARVPVVFVSPGSKEWN